MARWEREELQRSRDRGIWDAWGIQDHQVHDGRVSFAFRKSRIYAPLEHPELPNQFAALASDDPALSSFLSAYGRLGWYELLGHETVKGDWLRNKRREYRALLRTTGEVYVEYLDWILAHAKTVSWCLAAAHSLSMPSGAKQRAELERVAGAMPKPWGVRATVGHGAFLSEGLREKLNTRDYVGHVLEDVLWVNLRGVRRRVAYREGRLLTMWGGSSLLESIYTIIADANGRLAQCQACGSVFVQTDKRQRFCPPREGIEKSTCMNRLRIRRYRAKSADADGESK